jgi:hypothetical protein
MDLSDHTDPRADLRESSGTDILLALEAIQPRKCVVKKGFDVRQKMFQNDFEFQTALYKKSSGTNHNLCVVKKVRNV